MTTKKIFKAFWFSTRSQAGKHQKAFLIQKLEKMIETQECKYCLKVLPLSMYIAAPGNLNGLNRKCRTCFAEAHRAKHPVPPPPKDLEGEIWKEIDGYYGDYEVSNFGRVKSHKKNMTKLLDVHYNKKGYPQAHLARPTRKPQLRSRHRLVALTFIPNPENHPQVNHKDGNKLNNHVSNLEWCTNQHNMDHAIANNLMNPSRGAKNGMSKLTDEMVLKIRSDYPIKSQNELAREYKVSQTLIWNVVNRKTWFHI